MTFNLSSNIHVMQATIIKEVQQTSIAIARQNFQNKVFFFTFWGNFPYKKEKKSFMKNLPGASNTISMI
jgi:hypothetical protein